MIHLVTHEYERLTVSILNSFTNIMEVSILIDQNFRKDIDNDRHQESNFEVSLKENQSLQGILETMKTLCDFIIPNIILI